MVREDKNMVIWRNNSHIREWNADMINDTRKTLCPKSRNLYFTRNKLGWYEIYIFCKYEWIFYITDSIYIQCIRDIFLYTSRRFPADLMYSGKKDCCLRSTCRMDVSHISWIFNILFPGRHLHTGHFLILNRSNV